MNSLNCPVLFLIFNRPDTTQQVFEAIRNAKPKQLFVAADGPRKDKEGEKEKCGIVRNIATSVDWDCEVKTLFRVNNLGCGKAVSEAISWFFENVEEGIILEDDCLPDNSFFDYCAFLLNKYRNDDKIMHIGGSNFQFGIKRGDGDYYFSAISHVWGWATWRNAWLKYIFDLKKANDMPDLTYNFIFNHNQSFINYYKNMFNEMKEMRIDTWDYQWLYAINLNKGFSICPNVNLVKNIGFGNEGTHTLIETEWNTLNTAKSIYAFKDPSTISIDYDADAYTLREITGIKEVLVIKKNYDIKSLIRQVIIFLIKKYA